MRGFQRQSQHRLEQSNLRITNRKLRGMNADDPDGRVRAGRGGTELFIYPGYRYRSVDALLTNFHLPQSSLLMLVSAFAERDLILNAYRHAVAQKYRFYSYGDCMLII